MAVVPFQNLPIAEVSWNPSGKPRSTIENEILGNLDEPNWARYKKAHLIFDSNNQTTKAGYKLIIARMEKGKLQVILPQLGAAVAAINGARGGINVPMSEKKKAYNHIMKYYAKAGVEKKDRPKFVGSSQLALGRCVSLNINVDDLDSEDPKPVWVQITREGDYPGYANGDQPFAFTAEHFQEMINNLHSHPSYHPGPDGLGTENIIPWDFNHASEMFPAAGNLAVAGAPAQAWTRDLKMAKDKDNKTCLMAYTLFLEPALSYIREGRYAWASVAAGFDAIHGETAENIGAIISSIALTNTPFVEGMERLAASKGIDLRRYYGKAEDTLEAVSMLKNLFGLAETSTIEEVMLEVQKLATWIENGDVPLGVDTAELISSMRNILGLPVLSTESDVMNNALSISSRLIDETAVASGIPAIAGDQPLDQISDLVEPAMMAKKKEADMELIKVLASKLAIRESDDAVVAAVEELIALRSGVMDALKIEKDSNDVIISSANDFVSASTNLTNLLTALGVNDITEATAKVVTLTEHSVELSEIKPEFEEMMKVIEAQKDKQIEEDVAQVMNSKKFSEDLKEPLLLYRKSDPEGFAKKYPAVEDTDGKPDRHPMLTKTVAATPEGGEKKVGDNTVIPPGADVIDLSKYPGRNITERAVNCVKATIPESKDWQYEDIFVKACELKQQSNVVDSSN